MIEQWVIDRLNPLKSEDLVKVVQPTKPTTVPMGEKETNMTKTIYADYVPHIRPCVSPNFLWCQVEGGGAIPASA